MPYSVVKKNLELALKSANEEMKKVKNIIDIYRLIFKTHHDIITIHPFGDGNSRTSRLLLNYVQGWHRQPLTTVVYKDSYRYKKALETSWDRKEPELFINFMFHETIYFFSTYNQ